MKVIGSFDSLCIFLKFLSSRSQGVVICPVKIVSYTPEHMPVGILATHEDTKSTSHTLFPTICEFTIATA